MNSMFFDATAFNQNISGWVINQDLNPKPPTNFASGATAFQSQNQPKWFDIELDSNGITYKYIKSSLPAGSSNPYFTTGSNNIVYAVMSNSQDSINKIREYANDPTTSTTFTHNGVLIPFNRIVTSLMTNMNSMFLNKSSFNEDISSWDTSKVQNMHDIFGGARVFNQNISLWNVSNVEYMTGMFFNTQTFNQNISSWNVSKVIKMDYMFYMATAFNQNISGWVINQNLNPKPPTDFATGATVFQSQNQPIWQIVPIPSGAVISFRYNDEWTYFDPSTQATAQYGQGTNQLYKMIIYLFDENNVQLVSIPSITLDGLLGASIPTSSFSKPSGYHINTKTSGFSFDGTQLWENYVDTGFTLP